MKLLKQTSIAALFAALLPSAVASSHSDAPLIKQDPQANLTDLYAFVGTKFDDPSIEVLNVIVSVRPFSEPGDGIIYERFDGNAEYNIHLTNPTTGKETVRYTFKFSDPTKSVKNGNTILSYGLGTEAGSIQTTADNRQNFTQGFNLIRQGAGKGQVIGKGLVPPPNVGKRTTPFYNDAQGLPISGALTNAELDSYTSENIVSTRGVVAWAGPRDDGFFADTPGIFDFLNPRILKNDNMNGFGQDGDGVDGFQGFNVLTYGMQIPLSRLKKAGYKNVLGQDKVGVGVYASVGRQRVTILDPNPNKDRTSGPYIQVNRLGNPLFNEVLVATKDKDKYNRTKPEDDRKNFRQYALNSELAALINIIVFGSDALQTTNRTDLFTIFMPDVLRVDTQSGPVPLSGQIGFNRLSVFGGDALGWPNGRRPGDDVVDIALTAVASGPDNLATPTLVGDNIHENDMPYHQVFPFLATPHAGTTVVQRQSPVDNGPTP